MHVPPQIVRCGLRCARLLFESRRLPLRTKRRLVDLISGITRPPSGVAFDRDSMAGLEIERIRVAHAETGTLLYLHGGGYALGSARGYRAFVAQLAAATGSDAIIPDYSRSPEVTYPVALDEVFDIYELLQSRDSRTPIAIVGDSAGGGLALALAMRIRDRGLRPPAAVGLICPWADLSADVEGARAERNDPLITTALTAEWAKPYAGGTDARDVGISPALGDLAGLPPIILHSVPDDPIAADAELIEARFRDLSLDKRLVHHRYDGLWHVFHLQHGFLAAADRAVRDLGSALKLHLADGLNDLRRN